MAKKLVRLTEGDLHRIIKESVNNILTELDWKTYANAEKKAYKNYDKRGSSFRDAKVKSFNDKYSTTKEPEYVRNDMFDGYTPKYTYAMDRIRDRFGDKYYYPTYEKDDGYRKYRRALYPNGKYFNPDDGFDDTFDKVNWELRTTLDDKPKTGDSDFVDYNKGNYEYKKGKGWVKK